MNEYVLFVLSFDSVSAFCESLFGSDLLNSFLFYSLDRGSFVLSSQVLESVECPSFDQKLIPIAHRIPIDYKLLKSKKASFVTDIPSFRSTIQIMP